MSMIVTTGLPSPAIPELPVYRFTVDEYHRMIDAGLFQSPVELLEGWIVPKMGKNPPHVWTVSKAAQLLSEILPQGWHVRRQDPLSTSDSEPEPDLSVVQGTMDDYRTRHPAPNQTALAVEVADSSLSKDRNLKARLFARASIPVYWIVNLVDSQVEVYTDPSGPDADPCYRQQKHYGIDDAVPLVIDGKEIARIAVRDMLP